ncbi:MAG: AmmeMemoRadiSam system radical SAM enzyme [Chloroflexi bacterium B3_Chlor]|nr:MAG: AmmeMemoRadiSam system radical SAM enzyme [Chloroflexi bacterium B3_Chlor]
MRKEAMLYTKLDKGLVRCALCAHRCTMKPDRLGICGVRQNVEGTLYTLVYGQAIAVHVDPIEKKPIYNFLPGTRSFSIATVGCNFRCVFCQNADISQAPREGLSPSAEDFPPGQVVAAAKRYACDSIAYTYTEPTVFFEYAYDAAKLAHQEGIKNIFVTNGYMTLEALEEISPYLDAANVDLKSFSDAFYRRVCGARLQPVLETIEAMHQRGVWVEVTTLLIPGLNDSDDELRRIAQFVHEVGPDIPWHISRFTPRYKMRDKPTTSIERIHRAAEIGREQGLRYVYVGNVPGDLHENTLCPSCGEVVIGRIGYHTTLHLEGNRCASCGQELAVVRR